MYWQLSSINVSVSCKINIKEFKARKIVTHGTRKMDLLTSQKVVSGCISVSAAASCLRQSHGVHMCAIYSQNKYSCEGLRGFFQNISEKNSVMRTKKHSRYNISGMKFNPSSEMENVGKTPNRQNKLCKG